MILCIRPGCSNEAAMEVTENGLRQNQVSYVLCAAHYQEKLDAYNRLPGFRGGKVPDYEFTSEIDPADNNNIIYRATAKLGEEEMEHFRKRLETAYKQGWDACYFRIPLAGIPYPAPDDGPYSKENFYKTLHRVENEFDYEGNDEPDVTP